MFRRILEFLRVSLYCWSLDKVIEGLCGSSCTYITAIMTEEVDNWIKGMAGKTLNVMVSEMASKTYDLFEYNRSKGYKVTAPMVSTLKKALDYIVLQVTEIHTENKVMRARLEDRTEYSKMMADLAQKISRSSVSSVEEAPLRVAEIQQKKTEDYTVIVTTKTAEQDVSEVKDKIKELCKTKESFPAPSDVVITKAKQVIMRYKNRSEVEKARDSMVESDEIKDLIKVNIPVRRRERILLLSVDPSVGEDVVKSELESQIGEGGVGDTYTGLADKMETMNIEATTRIILEGLLKKPSREVRIIRKIETRQGKNNWLIDVDMESKSMLLEKKRICIDFERYRVVEFISIMRCFKCQKFGYLVNNCSGEIHCSKCAEAHNIKDCKSDTENCSNCYFENADGDCAHRADSSMCPMFIKYRESLIPRRS